MFKKAIAAMAITAATVAGGVAMAPASSAQTSACATPTVCAFTNGSGFSAFATANGTSAGAGEQQVQPTSVRRSRLASLRTRNVASSTDNGFDATAAAPVALGLVGLYGVAMAAVRRRASGSATA